MFRARLALKLVRFPRSLVAYPGDFTFYVADPSAPLSEVVTDRRRRQCRGLCISAAPAALDRYPRGITGHVAHPSRSILKLAERLVCSRS